MSIIDTFDMESKEIINAKDIVNPVEGFPEIVIAIFSEKFVKSILEKYDTEIIYVLSAGRSIPIYRFNYKGNELAFFHTLLGGAGSAGLLEEIIALGGKKILYFGSCGTLDKDLTCGHLIVPTSAYRDEGVSYHYAPPSDYIEVKNADVIANIFDEIGVPYNRTKTWTTDSFYRETKHNMEKRKADGCGVVEMECASVMSVGQFRNKDIYQFLYTADSLDGDSWDSRILGKMPSDMREKILIIALETAIRLR